MKLDREKELEDFLCNNRNEKTGYYEDVIDGGLWRKEFRQFRIGSYGIADIVRLNQGISDSLEVQIVELKKGVLDKPALMQICRYKTGLARMIDKVFPDGMEVEFSGSLVGSDIETNSDIVYVMDQIPWLEVYTFEISISTGIDFEDYSSWSLKNENFNMEGLPSIFKFEPLKGLS